MTWRFWLQTAVLGTAAVVAWRVLAGTRLASARVGIVVTLLAYFVAWRAELPVVQRLIEVGGLSGLLLLGVALQPELRAWLLRSPTPRGPALEPRLAAGAVEDEIGDALERMSRTGIGAIIVVEREQPLDDVIGSGTALEARVTADLLAAIFTPYSPLHDGAVVVRGDLIVGAGCILPLSAAPLADRQLGTRHRAAVGLSEETDALVLVVSEERATISVAEGGQLRSPLTPSQVRDVIGRRPMRLTREHEVVRMLAPGDAPRGLT